MSESDNKPTISIEEVKSEEKPKKQRKKPQTAPLKHSNFFITINTQKNMQSLQKDEYDKLVSDFQTVIREFYNDRLKNLDFVIMEGSKQGESFGMPRDASRDELIKRIKNIEAKFVIEVGPESHKLHSHGMIAMSKRGLDTKLNFNTIREWLKERLGFECHMNVKLFSDAKKSLENYIEKNPFN